MTPPRPRLLLLLAVLAGCNATPPEGGDPVAPGTGGAPRATGGAPAGTGGGVGTGGSVGGTGGAGNGGSAAGTGGAPGTGGVNSGEDAGPTAETAPPPETDAGPLPPAKSGLEQLLVSRALGLAYYHSCLILPGGSLRCAGDKANAGDPRIHPPAVKAEQIMAAHNGFCVLRQGATPALPFPGLAVTINARRLTCWGHKDTFFPPGNLEMDPIQYGIGYDHGCVLNRDNSVACWGSGGEQARAPAGLKAKTLTVAAFFNCAIKMDDSVQCWGIKAPAPPAGLKAKIVAAVFHGNSKIMDANGAAETSHACAITLDDKVQCWGSEVEGNLTPPPDLTTAKDIAVATYDSCALRPNGEPVCWGRKVYDNFDAVRYHKRPEGIRLKGIRASMATYCGIKVEDDTVVCWGDEQHDHITFPAGGVKVYSP